MNIESLMDFLDKIKVALYSLIFGICLLVTMLMLALTNNPDLSFLTLIVSTIIGFISHKRFLSVLFRHLKTQFLDPIVAESNRHTQMMVMILDMAVKGEMLPITRDGFLYYVLKEEGHKEAFIRLIKHQELSHILQALHESLDRCISDFTGIELDVKKKIVLEQLKTMKEMLPAIA
jgi:hypothetical protein